MPARRGVKAEGVCQLWGGAGHSLKVHSLKGHLLNGHSLQLSVAGEVADGFAHGVPGGREVLDRDLVDEVLNHVRLRLPVR